MSRVVPSGTLRWHGMLGPRVHIVGHWDGVILVGHWDGEGCPRSSLILILEGQRNGMECWDQVGFPGQSHLKLGSPQDPWDCPWQFWT